MSAPEPVPDPAVPPEAYDEAYSRQACAGYEEWAAPGGRDADSLYTGILTLAAPHSGEVVVHVGTGRGGLVAAAVERGAGRGEVRFGEIRRALRPGGRLLVHTMPNQLVHDVTSRLHRLVARVGGARVQHGRWMHDQLVPEAHRGVYRWLAPHRPTRALGAADLFATAHRPA